MTPFFALLTGLTLLGGLSPLLTFAALFQQKEWRLDRLREHLRRDGWFIQLFGTIRPTLVAAYLALWLILGIKNAGTEEDQWQYLGYLIAGAFVTQVLFALLTIAQFVLRKQRRPVWTAKAMLIVGLSMIIDCVIVLSTSALTPYLPFLIILQPVIVKLAWLILLPVDAILKKRVMDRAMMLRSQMNDATVIGIAGSVGKTTVKELIAHLLQDLHPLVTPAHVNTEMGVAKWILGNSKLETRNSKLLIVEMGAYRKGEIALLCRISQPTIGVMTALGSDHLALFGSEQNIIDANGELIAALPSSGHAFFYGDNAGCKELAKRAPCPVTIAEATDAMHPLQGRHNDYNVSLAIAVAEHLGIKEDRITALLKTFKPQAHTFSVKTEHGVTILDDTYNISPLSFAAALDWAAARTERPRVLLTSGLQETGPEEKRFLTELGMKAAKSVERVIFTDHHGTDIFAKAFGKPVEILNKDTQRIAAGSVLLAVGRMPLSTVQRLIPHQPRVADTRLS
jgi:UDP-N-acetylmuramoyl-tripeptide--D-alanyl-D-alanine ligase